VRETLGNCHTVLGRTSARNWRSSSPASGEHPLAAGDYTHAEPPKFPSPVPVRVSRKSQLIAALRQNVRPIIIEDQELARPFARLLQARELRLWALGGLAADTMSYAIRRS
jgi:hypothetical protein